MRINLKNVRKTAFHAIQLIIQVVQAALSNIF